MIHLIVAALIQNTEIQTDLLEVLFDLAWDEWVVDDGQHQSRVAVGDPAADQQSAVR